MEVDVSVEDKANTKFLVKEAEESDGVLELLAPRTKALQSPASDSDIIDTMATKIKGQFTHAHEVSTTCLLFCVILSKKVFTYYS